MYDAHAQLNLEEGSEILARFGYRKALTLAGFMQFLHSPLNAMFDTRHEVCAAMPVVVCLQ